MIIAAILILFTLLIVLIVVTICIGFSGGRSGQNQPCTRTLDCLSGFVCENLVCKGDVGQVCNTLTDCSSDATACTGGRCISIPRDGPGGFPPCQEGLVIVDGRCLVPIGGPCQVDADCVKGVDGNSLCTNGMCQAQAPITPSFEGTHINPAPVRISTNQLVVNQAPVATGAFTDVATLDNYHLATNDSYVTVYDANDGSLFRRYCECEGNKIHPHSIAVTNKNIYILDTHRQAYRVTQDIDSTFHCKNLGYGESFIKGMSTGIVKNDNVIVYNGEERLHDLKYDPTIISLTETGAPIYYDNNCIHGGPCNLTNVDSPHGYYLHKRFHRSVYPLCSHNCYIK